MIHAVWDNGWCDCCGAEPGWIRLDSALLPEGSLTKTPHRRHDGSPSPHCWEVTLRMPGVEITWSMVQEGDGDRDTLLAAAVLEEE